MLVHAGDQCLRPTTGGLGRKAKPFQTGLHRRPVQEAKSAHLGVGGEGELGRVGGEGGEGEGGEGSGGEGEGGLDR